MIFILWIIYHWTKLEIFHSEEKLKKTSITVLIPFRNEEENLEKCIQSVLNQKYPAEHLEIIALNDHSDDESEKIIKKYTLQNSNIKLINLTSEYGKKEALEKGISIAKHSWIVTLDADCIVKENWLEKLNQYIQKTGNNYVVMPVIYHQEKSFFERIQSLEFLTLVATSAACIQGKNPLMSNGANTAFSKVLFNQVNGFEGNKHISSGDDVFLLQKIIALENHTIGYLHHQDVIAYTNATSTLKQFVKQRVRWGSKSKAYKSKFSIGIAILIFIINIELILTLLLAIGQQISWNIFLILFLVKLLFDTIFIRISTPFYGKEKLAFLTLQLAILYPIYIFVISFLSFIYRPTWKGRKINTK